MSASLAPATPSAERVEHLGRQAVIWWYAWIALSFLAGALTAKTSLPSGWGALAWLLVPVPWGFRLAQHVTRRRRRPSWRATGRLVWFGIKTAGLLALAVVLLVGTLASSEISGERFHASLLLVCPLLAFFSELGVWGWRNGGGPGAAAAAG